MPFVNKRYIEVIAGSSVSGGCRAILGEGGTHRISWEGSFNPGMRSTRFGRSRSDIDLELVVSECSGGGSRRLTPPPIQVRKELSRKADIRGKRKRPLLFFAADRSGVSVRSF
ncbi:hypothetical protein MRX96_056322 [Rhipicephalus microplus]